MEMDDEAGDDLDMPMMEEKEEVEEVKLKQKKK
jgi:hypothetical protein